MMNLTRLLHHQHLHPFGAESVRILAAPSVTLNRTVCTRLGSLSGSFITLPLFGTHSRLDTVCILRTGWLTLGADVSGAYCTGKP